MTAFRPITLPDHAARALAEGRLTQWRWRMKLRGMRPEFCGAGRKGDPDWNDPTCWGWEDFDSGDWIMLEKEPGQRMGWRDLAVAVSPGDRLWVRETFCAHLGDLPRGTPAPARTVPQNGGTHIWYKADGPPPEHIRIRWRSPVTMPKWASRWTLVVESVAVARVQDVTEEDAVACGVYRVAATAEDEEWYAGYCADMGREPTAKMLGAWCAPGVRTRWYGETGDQKCPGAEVAFRLMWEARHGPGSWERNDWCAVARVEVAKP